MRIAHEVPKHMLLNYLNARIDENFTTDNALPMGIFDKQGRLAAVWAWHNFQESAGVIEFSGASETPRWMTRRILHQLFSYAFSLAQMVVTRNSEHNTTLHRQLEAFGFEKIVLPRLFGRCEDCFYWYLTEEAWIASPFFIRRASNGQEIRSTCTA